MKLRCGMKKVGASTVALDFPTTRVEEIITPERYGAKGDDSQDDQAAIQETIDSITQSGMGTGPGFSTAPTLVFSPRVYKIGSEVAFLSTHNITVRAYGARFHYTGAGKCFSFTSCNYPKWFGGQIEIEDDTTDIIGMYITDTNFGIFKDFDVGAVDNTYDSNNIGIYLYAGAGGGTDCLYNTFRNIELNRLGQALKLETADAEASVSRINNNQFLDVKLHSNNGLWMQACSSNYFRITLENHAAQLELKDNANDIGSKENYIDVTYYGTYGFANTNTADTYSVDNTIITRHGGSVAMATDTVLADHLNLPGKQFQIKPSTAGGELVNETPKFNLPRIYAAKESMNYVPYSEDFSQWTATNVTVSANSVVAPDGTTTADTLTSTVADGMVECDTAIIGDGLDSKRWIGSVWLRAATAHYATLYLVDYTGTADRYAPYSVIWVPTTWKRYYISYEWGDCGSGDYLQLRIYPSRKGGGATGAVYAWGAQIQPGYLGQYQKTAGSVVSLPNLAGFELDNSDVSTSGTGEDDLKSTIIPSSSLGDKAGIRVFAAGTKTAVNDDKTIKLHFGASNWTIHAAANDANDWRLQAEIFNTGYNAQRISWVCWNGVIVAQGYETAAIDCEADVTLKLTGECTHASDTITQTMWVVERF